MHSLTGEMTQYEDRSPSLSCVVHISVIVSAAFNLPARTLRSSDKLLLTVRRMALALSAKAFSVSAPYVWNSVV